MRTIAKLTEKQKRFVDEYLIDLNATRAYMVAYPSVKSDAVAAVNASKLLRNPKVAAYITERQREIQKRTEISQDRVITELARIAFTERGAFARVTGGGRTVELTDTDELTADQRAALSGVEETKFGIKVSTYDKVRALELLGKHLGIFDGKSGQDNGRENNLLEAIKASGEVDVNDIPEVE